MHIIELMNKELTFKTTKKPETGHVIALYIILPRKPKNIVVINM